jgi:hypothetical protein
MGTKEIRGQIYYFTLHGLPCPRKATPLEIFFSISSSNLGLSVDCPRYYLVSETSPSSVNMDTEPIKPVILFYSNFRVNLLSSHKSVFMEYRRAIMEVGINIVTENSSDTGEFFLMRILRR